MHNTYCMAEQSCEPKVPQVCLYISIPLPNHYALSVKLGKGYVYVTFKHGPKNSPVTIILVHLTSLVIHVLHSTSMVYFNLWERI